METKASTKQDWDRYTQLSPSAERLIHKTRPFADEEEYWEHVSAILGVMHWIEDVGEDLFQWATQPIDPKEKELPGQLEAVKTRLQEIKQKLFQAFEIRKTATLKESFVPCALKLAQKLDLSENELWLVHYLVALVTDVSFGEKRMRYNEGSDIAEFMSLDTVSFFALFDTTGPLFTKGVIQIDGDVLSPPAKRSLSMDLPTVKAIRGLVLSAEERYSLQGGELGKLLQPEADGETPPETEERQTAQKADVLGQESEKEDISVDSNGGETGGVSPDNILDFFQTTETETETEIVNASNPKTTSKSDTASEVKQETSDLEKEDILPYREDLEYVEDYFEWFEGELRWKKALLEKGDVRQQTDRQKWPARLREAAVKAGVCKQRIAARLKKTKETTDWLPRAERLAQKLGLSEFEKHVILISVGAALCKEYRELFNRENEIQDLLYLFCDSAKEQVQKRKYFYKDAKLVKTGLIRVSGLSYTEDLLSMDVTVDRRMADYLVGLENETISMVEGSHIYTPSALLKNVVIGQQEKDLIVKTAENYPAFQRERKRCGLDEIVSYGRGLVMLFYGPSGTGKTLMANALANHLGKKILLVNYPTIGDMSSDESLKLLLREAKIHDAVIFFDECEGIFEDRGYNSGISLLLTELERHDGLVIMATNRPFDLDEAMHRRITLAVEFRVPDTPQRKHIWKAHLPAGLQVEEATNLAELAYRYELTGGLIKNAVLAALSIATGRNSEKPIIRYEDLEKGARLQMRGRLAMYKFEDRVVPKMGLQEVVLPEDLHQAIDDLIGFEKARRVLVGEWGFAGAHEKGLGTTALFYGPPGTGKSLTAEAVAYELGRPIKLVNAAQLVSKWVGEGAKNIQALMREARQNDAVLVFDEADALFANRTAVSTATDRYANLDSSVLLAEMERFAGVVILTSNMETNIDQAFRRRLRFVLQFKKPDRCARLALWKKHLPSQTPLAKDVDLEQLANEFALTGAQIRNACFKAAARAALRQQSQRTVTQKDLLNSARKELGQDPNTTRNIGFATGR
jgi:SpoVK/Ycf46/Vps4 family AAA+-type ATPase